MSQLVDPVQRNSFARHFGNRRCLRSRGSSSGWIFWSVSHLYLKAAPRRRVRHCQRGRHEGHFDGQPTAFNWQHRLIWAVGPSSAAATLFTIANLHGSCRTSPNDQHKNRVGLSS